MFDTVQKNKTLVTVVLGLVSLGLVIGAGVTGYSAFSDDGRSLAKVDGQPITEYDLAELTNGQPVSNEMKPMLLEQVVQQRLVLAAAAKANVTAGKGQLQQAIAAVEAFQVDGKFDATRYQEMLASQRMTPAQFEQRVSDSIVARALLGSVAATDIRSQRVNMELAKLVGERRQVSASLVEPTDFASTMSASEADIKAYYDKNALDFRAPEMVKVEYVALSRDELAAATDVSDADVSKYFDEHKAALTKEERDVAHILIAAPKDADAKTKAEAKAKAEGLIAELKKNPARFAELAKANSQDPGSAEQGGELGSFGRDAALVEPFKDAMFKQSVGEIGAPVETEFGYHIIRVNSAKQASFDDVKPQVIATLKAEQIAKQFPKMVEELGELAYNQADSLKPAAERFKLAVQQSGWITREGSADAALNSKSLADAVFSDDVLKAKHNTEAVEVEPGKVVVARVIEHKPAAQVPLADVKDAIAKRIVQEKATAEAARVGAERVAQLQKGQALELKWDEAQPVARLGHPGVSAESLRAIFKVDGSKLPAYVGEALKQGGYRIYKVEAVTAAPAPAPAMLQSMNAELGQLYGQADVAAYLKALRASIPVEYHKAPAAQ
ncbi:peptidylprolyl isomerase [Chitinibacteraceae bacterium HSL-7]